MKYYTTLILFFIFLSCSEKKNKDSLKIDSPIDFVISFGSCDNQNIPNLLWGEILKNKPDVFIWGGDIVYSDTDNMQLMKSNYEQQKNDPIYQNFTKQVSIMGTWDDHDYGLNDGGIEFQKKDSVQQFLLDFLDVEHDNKRRNRKGVYYAEKYAVKNFSINIIVLDTRYFRTALTKDPSGEKRYIPNENEEGSILGSEQWNWLSHELNNSSADFNIIISSIQFLSKEHGFECWGNMPHELLKMKNIIVDSKAKGIIFLSGDRHIAEISKESVPDLNYPLIDFTSSGLTHSYDTFVSESNAYRISDVVPNKNFGILKFNSSLSQVIMEIRGENNNLYQTYIQNY